MFKGKFFETFVGIIVLITAIFFLFYAQKKAGVKEINGYTLTAKFDKADGIRPGSDVKISGIKVGYVMSTKIDPVSYLALVEIKIDANLSLPLDSSMSVSTSGFLGGKYLSISPGGDTEVLHPGDEIKFTQGSVNLESLLSKFMFNSDEKKK